MVVPGQPAYGMAAVGPGKTSPGAELILRAAEKADPRPLWVLAWGGTNTLAQALLVRAVDADARAGSTPSSRSCASTRSPTRTTPARGSAASSRRCTTSRRPPRQDGEEYYFATWTGISGDRFYRNAPGADFTTFTDEWVNANIRSKGPLGKLYPFPCCIHEGDTPSFLGLIDNGLASAMSPAYGGWGGRYVWRQPSGETRPFWTQGGDSYPGQRQLARHGDRRRREGLHVRPGHDLALADGVPARLRGADGLDDQGRRARRTTTRRSW